jgi:hypothetical protein
MTTQTIDNNYATSNQEILAAALAEVRQHLHNFALNSDFLTQMQLAYGDNFDAAVALDLAQAWQDRDFSVIPAIEFLSSAELNGANGAYAAANDTIYVSQEFIAQNQANLAALTNLLLEEIGHRIDTLLNTTDSAGDEGAIFAEIATRGG